MLRFREFVEHPLQIVGQRALELHTAALGRVRERQPRGMEKRAIEVGHCSQIPLHPAMDSAVQRIADDGMADGAEVHANLMRPTRVNRHARQGQDPSEVLGFRDSRHRFA